MNKTGIVIILLCFLAAAAVVLWERRKARKTMEEIERDRKSTRLNSSHPLSSRMPSSA